jgi:hypothetical protein
MYGGCARQELPQFSLFPSILTPSFVAELSLCLWRIVKGVNVPNLLN